MTSKNAPWSPRRSIPRRRRFTPAIEPMESRVVPSTSTWTGMGDGANWSNANNWDHAPQAGSDLVFPVLASKKYQIVDDLASFTANSLTLPRRLRGRRPLRQQLQGHALAPDPRRPDHRQGGRRRRFGSDPFDPRRGLDGRPRRGRLLLPQGRQHARRQRGDHQDGPGTLGFLPTQTSAYSGSIEVAAGSVVALSSATIAAPVTVDASAILEVSAGLTLSLADLEGTGTAQVDSGASLLIDGNQQVDLVTLVTGAGTLIENSSQTLVLEAPDSVSIVDVRSGTVQLGTGSDTSSLTISSDIEVEASGSLDVENFDATIGSLDGPGSLDLDEDLTIGDAKSTSITGTIGGGADLIEQGMGTIIVSPGTHSNWSGNLAIGANEQTKFAVNGVVTATPQKPDNTPGPIRIGGGGITVGESTGLPPVVTVNPGTTVKIAGKETVLDISQLQGGTIQLADGGSLRLTTQVAYAFSASITGAGSLIKQGPGILTFSGSITFTGTIEVDQGTLSLGAVGTGTEHDLDVAQGAILQLGGPLTATSSTDEFGDAIAPLRGGGEIELGGSTLAIDTGNSDADVEIDAAPTIVGAGGILQEGSGTLVLDVPINYTGPFEVRSGTLALNDQSDNPNAFVMPDDIEVDSGATLSDNSPITVGSLGGAGTIEIEATVTTGDAASTSFTGTLDDGFGDSLIEQGTGAFSLAPTSTSSITPLTVRSGTLILGGPNGQLASPITLGGGTLAGAGVSVANPTIQSGTIAPGTSSTPGTLTLSGATLTVTTTVAIRLDGTSAGNSDQLDSGGVVDLGGSTLSTSLGYAAKAGDAITILAASGGSSYFVGQFAGLADGATLYAGGEPFSIHYAMAKVSGMTRTVAVTLTRVAAASSTTVVVPAVATAGRPVVLVAHVAEVGPATGVPSGMVQFFDGQKLLNAAPVDASGTARLVVPSLTPGSHLIKASYVASANDTASTSFASTLFVGPATKADLDGDGKTDVAIFRPSTDTFYALDSSNGAFVAKQFGAVGDVPVPGDFDGDGKTDVAVFRPSTQTFYILDSSNGAFVVKQFGAPGDVPVPADYDGDGRTDIAVFRPSTDTFYVLDSSNGAFVAKQFGAIGDQPVPADYDADGKADFAVFRPSTDTYFILGSFNGAFVAKQFGAVGDVPVPANYDGDGRTDLAVFRPSTASFFVLDSSTGAVVAKQFGAVGDVPIPGDFDGDGLADFAVFRPGTSSDYILNSLTGTVTAQQFGAAGDVALFSEGRRAVPDDYAGDGHADVTVFHPSTATFSTLDPATGASTTTQFGSPETSPSGATSTATAGPTSPSSAPRRRASTSSTPRPEPSSPSSSAPPATSRSRPTTTAMARPTSPSSGRAPTLFTSSTRPTGPSSPSSSGPPATSRSRPITTATAGPTSRSSARPRPPSTSSIRPAAPSSPPRSASRATPRSRPTSTATAGPTSRSSAPHPTCFSPSTPRPARH